MKQTDAVQLAFKREADPRRPAQPRQDDRLGGSRLRLCRPGGPTCSRACSRRPSDACGSSSSTPIPSRTASPPRCTRRVVAALRGAGHEVDDCDLYAEGFDPVLSREERRAYHDVPGNIGCRSRPMSRRLKAAEALVLVFPVWNFGFPAILKGFFDRVFLPGVSLRARRRPGTRRARATSRRLVAVTTYGGSRLRALLARRPAAPRRRPRMIRAAVRPFARCPLPRPLRHEQRHAGAPAPPSCAGRGDAALHDAERLQPSASTILTRRGHDQPATPIVSRRTVACDTPPPRRSAISSCMSRGCTAHARRACSRGWDSFPGQEQVLEALAGP